MLQTSNREVNNKPKIPPKRRGKSKMFCALNI